MKTNQENYKWGFIYFDPKDSRVIVPKSVQWLGWTFNFARPETYLIILAFIALMVFVSIY
ncbi:MAG TPA: DUF5808 domain-containing protein [Draconibacterium sp.]|nr:DUF5808 domain-containing protein [Draconibacterium sp.]